MTVIERFAASPQFQALGWTLVYSVWQCAAVWLGLLAARFLLRDSGARMQYAAACIALLLMLTIPAATFVELIGRPYDPRLVDTSQAPRNAGLYGVWPDRAANVGTGLESALPFFVCLWLCGVAALSLRTLGGILLLRRGTRTSTDPIPEEWVNAMARVRARMGVSRVVRLCCLARDQSPAVIGWMRPVVLAPAAALSGLTAQQLEAIFAHELAHVRRLDCLVNLIQTFAEVLLFFHPAAWWVSRQIRATREYCCDDMAAAACGGSGPYARALVQLEQMRLAQQQLAIAATGGSLQLRIERLLFGSREYASARSVPAVLMAAGIMAALLAGVGLTAQTLSATYSKWLNEDVPYIITPLEKSEFLGLKTDDLRDRFITEFWKKRDPNPQTADNEFKDEHYRRFSYTNKRFGDGVAGWKTERGRVYILYGPPDEIDSHPPRQYEEWLYQGELKGIGKKPLFHFDLSGKTLMKVTTKQ